MTEVIICILVFACLMCLYSMVIVTLEIIKERKDKNTATSRTTPVVNNSVTETVIEESIDDIEDVDSVKTIRFNDVVESFREKLKRLSKETKSYVKQLETKASSYEKVKVFEKKDYIEFRIGSNKLIKMKIKKDALLCEFILPNLDMKTFIKGNQSNVKVKPIVIKVIDEETLELALGSIQIAHDSILKEREMRKQLRKERRMKV